MEIPNFCGRCRAKTSGHREQRFCSICGRSLYPEAQESTSQIAITEDIIGQSAGVQDAVLNMSAQGVTSQSGSVDHPLEIPDSPAVDKTTMARSMQRFEVLSGESERARKASKPKQEVVMTHAGGNMGSLNVAKKPIGKTPSKAISETAFACTVQLVRGRYAPEDVDEPSRVQAWHLGSRYPSFVSV
jgi:hypothetical protein